MADYSRLRAHGMELSDPASVMCSGGIIPEHTFTGERLLDLMRHPGRASLLSVSAFADATLGFVVFAWLKDHTKYCERLVGSLSTLSDSSLTSSLISFFSNAARTCTCGHLGGGDFRRPLEKGS